MRRAPAFELTPIVVAIEKIVPTRIVNDALKASRRYKAIAASIAEVGIIEPLVVHAAKNPKGAFLLLDGHARLEVLKERGFKEVRCLVSTDDEGYTYNQKVNRLAPIQEHKMIQRAIDAGVPPERVAKALNLSVETVLSNQSMLANICAEAVELLKDKPIGESALRYFKRVKPMRQIDMAELMNTSGLYAASYAKVLADRTPREQIVDPDSEHAKPKNESLAKMESELLALEKDFRMLDGTYGRDVLTLTLVQKYIKTLLANPQVARYLAKHYDEYLSEFRTIVEAMSLET